MPYRLSKVKGGFKVTEAAGGNHPGKAFSKRPQTRAKAAAQLRAIEANSKEK